MTISIGSAAIDRGASSSTSAYTRIWFNAPCSGNGTIDTVEIYAAATAIVGLKSGTFYHTIDNNYVSRDYETLGDGSANAKTTFTGLNIDAELGDYLGMISTSGSVKYEATGEYGGLAYIGSDEFGTGEHTYTLDGTNYACSYYGTGTGGGVGATSKTINIRLGNLYAQNIQVLSPTGWTKGKIN
jgi:hypothetical protein